MSLEDLGNVGEFLAAIGVIVSLIYLALQIRQNTESVRASTQLASRHAISEFNRFLAHDDETARLWRTGLSDIDQLSEDERMRFSILLFNLFGDFESFFHQYQKATLEAEHWERWSKVVSFYITRPVVAEWWNKRTFPFTKGFKQYVDGLLEKQRPRPG